MDTEYTRLEYLFDKDKIEKIKNAKVCVVGLGGVGGAAVEVLSRTGIGNLIICDFDKVSITNINRQVIANHNTIGKSKVDVTYDFIKSINPNINVTKVDKKLNQDNLELFDLDFDYLIDAIDDLDSKYLIYLECIKRNITFISSMGTAKKLDPTKFQITDIRKTSYDAIAKILRKRLRNDGIIDKIMVVSSLEEPMEGKLLGSYMPVVTTAGLLCSDYIIKEIIK